MPRSTEIRQKGLHCRRSRSGNGCRLEIRERVLIRFAFTDHSSLHSEWVGDVAVRMLFHDDLELPGHISCSPLTPLDIETNPDAVSCSGKFRMRVPLADGWYLCNRSDRPDYEYTEFRGGRTLARQWARRFLDDSFSLGALRRLLIGTSPARSDEQIVEELAWRLMSG